jgi:pimeloyl-ACP methyl ester carboxylesterase
MDFFSAAGYNCINPPWPGDSATVTECRANPTPIAKHGVKEVADSYAKIIATLPAPPILIGHSFGGLLVQELLGRGIAAAAIAIDPAPVKGVWQLPFSALKSALPVLGNPFNYSKAVSLTLKEFKYAFANNLTDAEAKDIYDRYTIPAPARPLFQVAFATVNPSAENKVNTANTTRGPLLLVSGEKDHIVPPVLVKATLKKYSKSTAVTELKSFAGRGHSLASDNGWREIAEYSLAWLNGKGL